ncbi:SubName: Full=Uncharacterized protein {ECO:0000313/EMBL:CCA70853.1} [Serendipita indica DSM 11827]|uniref:F-box domain-containing protein n=1 Tax=Serendipita indica (strain DSM 11827) TaxID=1109443 RepID=G4THR0_SERID|nr:SubName: Full=Uncharacterized protein {ECO:0000313/EMBL:CCA70853.1} [Serendipita indica DSM 11827]CCA70853.1 hypothetical protein PIIN_04788 [Serendipita indica DSM 11827]
MGEQGGKNRENFDGVDYLSRLPTELWRKILQSTYPSVHEPAAMDPYEFCRGWNLSSTKEDPVNYQPYRAQLRLVCKRLEPLAVELLFTDVALQRNQTHLESFLYMATIGTHPPGYYTRRLTLSTPNVSSDTIDECVKPLDKIAILLPNLVTLVLISDSEDAEDPSYVGWIRNLRHIYWFVNEYAPKTITQILTQNSELETLILDCQPWDTVETSSSPIYHTHLKRASVESIAPGQLFTTLPPTLEWLSLYLPSCWKFDPLLFSTARITLLDIYLPSVIDSLTPTMDIIFEVLYACPLLQTVSTYPIPCGDGPVKYYGPHPSLKNLVITSLEIYLLDLLKQWGFKAGGWEYPRFEMVLIRCYYSGCHTINEPNVIYTNLLSRLDEEGRTKSRFVVERATEKTNEQL